jgi:hypothetical protein
VANTKRGATALRLLLEGFVVLVSILAAFLLEGWRNDRAEAHELQQELVSVGREIDRNRDIVLAELSAIHRIIAGGDELLEQLESERESRFVVVTDSIAWLATLWSPTLDPSLGAVDALISSGRLARIHDPELRLGLAGLRDMFIDAAQEQLLAQSVSTEQLQPRVLESPDMARLRRVTREFITRRQDAGLSPQEQMAAGQMPSYGDVAYANNVSIRSALNMKLIWYEAALAELDPLLPHLANLADLAGAEAR